jgi:hypothetical protein
MTLAQRHIKIVFMSLALCVAHGLLGQTSQVGTRIEQGYLFDQSGLFYIKGVCYHPVAVGRKTRSFERLNEDLVLMRQAGINAIRVYEPIDDLSVLDAIYQSGIKVIMGFGYDQNGYYDLRSGTYLDYVKRFKDHPAILFWELGNEYNFNPQWFGGTLDLWYDTLANAVDAIHGEDPNHPVASAHGEVPEPEVFEKLDAIDLWGMNVYRWDESYKALEAFSKRSDKPVYFSELGADSYMTNERLGYAKGPNQRAQADATEKILKAIMIPESRSAGVAVFSFTDGWWKAGHPERQDVGGWAPGSSGVPYDATANEEYWGIVDIDRKKKLVYGVIQEIFKDYSGPRVKPQSK